MLAGGEVAAGQVVDAHQRQGQRVGKGHLDRGFAGAFGPSLPRTWVTCVLPVSSVTIRSWAMRWFDLPAAAAPAAPRHQAGGR